MKSLKLSNLKDVPLEGLPLAFDNLPLGISILNPDMKILWANKPVERLLGVSLGEIRGKYCYKVAEKKEKVCEGCGVAEAFKDGKTHVFEKETFPGFIVRSTAIPIKENGKVVAVLEIIQDVTDRTTLKEKLEIRENRFKELFENSLDAIVVTDLEGNIIAVNKGFERITGFSRSEVLGENYSIFVPEEFATRIFEKYNEAYRNDKNIYSIQFEFFRKTGEKRVAEGNVSLIKRCGRVIGFQSNFRDVTEKKALEERSRQSERMYRMLVDSSIDAIVTVDEKGKILMWNKGAERIFGYRAEEIIGENLVTLIPRKLRRRHAKGFSSFSGRKFDSGKRIEALGIRKDGEEFPVEVSYYFWESNGKTYFTSIIRDISERRRLERKLKESEEMFRALAEKSLVGIYLIQDGVFKYVNPKMAELWGYSVEELIGKSPLDFIHPEDRETVKRNIERSIRGEIDAINYRLKMVRKDGEMRYNEVFGSRTVYKGKPAVIGTLIDVTEEEKLIRKLREYERFYKNAQDLFFVLDSKARFVDVNPKYAEMLGFKKEELIGHTAKRFLDPSELDKAREMFRRVMEGESVRYETIAVSRDRRKSYFVEIVVWPVLENGKIVGAEGIVRDITERKQMETKIKESEEKYKKIFQNSPVLIAIVDEEGKFVEANPSVIRSLGNNPVGKTIFEVLPYEEVKKRYNYFWKALRTNKKVSFQHTRNRRHFITNVIPLELDSKKNLLVISEDVTELIRSNRVLEAINKINKLIAHEKDKRRLLEKASKELSSLKDYLTVTIFFVEGDEIKPVSVSGESQDYLEKRKDCKLIREAVRRKIAVESNEEICGECQIRERDEIDQAVSFPMIVDGEVRGVITVCYTEKVSEEEKEMMQILANDLAYAIKSIESEELRKRAFRQIDQNIEQFAILTDHIKNPLNVILGVAETSLENADDRARKAILESVKRIEKVIKKLDEGWLESEEIRNFLKRYLN